MTPNWLEPWLQTFDDNTEEDTYPNGLNDHFSDSGISNVSFLKNLQSTLVYLMIFVSAHALYPVLK